MITIDPYSWNLSKDVSIRKIFVDSIMSYELMQSLVTMTSMATNIDRSVGTADAQTVTNGVHFRTSLWSNNWDLPKTNLALISIISSGHKFALIMIVRVIICIKIQWLSHQKMHFQMSSAKCRPFVQASVCQMNRHLTLLVRVLGYVLRIF